MKKIWMILMAALLVASFVRATENESTENQEQQTPPETNITIYPVLVQAPIFGATVNLPELPGGGGGIIPGGNTRSTETSLQGAYMGGVEVDNPKWMMSFAGLWMSFGTDRQK